MWCGKFGLDDDTRWITVDIIVVFFVDYRFWSYKAVCEQILLCDVFVLFKN